MIFSATNRCRKPRLAHIKLTAKVFHRGDLHWRGSLHNNIAHATAQPALGNSARSARQHAPAQVPHKENLLPRSMYLSERFRKSPGWREATQGKVPFLFLQLLHEQAFTHGGALYWAARFCER